ncbi:restriction endonuclease subunit S [Salmonella enterica subsp. enterica serovar Georgia]|uniref:restriction endonuclease subunit S n=2 Tax=Salmonella enterica TaxID=28901 RepID=UPI0009AC08CA|nr:restriction endonuclease subunit S [Salmonella enterica]EAP4688006.1 restriction endonuclease subunit S [Salmonella enterica]EKE2798731.1 restriction endonuclease subunit S [Salmonella enterica]
MSFDILDNLSIKLIDGDRGKNYPKQSDFFDKSDCLFLSAKNVTKAGFEFTDCSFISKEKDQQLRAGKLERNDIVLTTRGTIGNSALYDSSVSISSVRINSGMIILRPDTNIWNPRFLYFLLNSDFVLQQISALTSGSAVPQLPARDLKKFILPRVSLDKQHKIVEIIGSIVDKIRVSKAINQTLEQMAQALFKSWFVDFEPVKAKIAVLEAGGSQEDATLAAMTAISGKDADALAVFEREHPEQYAELKATAELFPSVMQGHELGEIPEGWQLNRLSNLAILHYGKALKKTERIEGPYPVYGSGGITGSHNNYLVEGPSIIVGRKGSIGTLYWEDGKFHPIDTVYFVEGKDEIPLTYLYYLMKTLNLSGMNTDAAVPGLNRDNVYRLEVLQPDKFILSLFDKHMSAIRNNIQKNDFSTVILSDLRDTLLPKLLSGEITLPEAEQIISEEA